MSEEKSEEARERNAHKFALGGRVVGVLSIVLLVPAVRRLRAQRQERHHHRRFLLGH